MKNNNVVNPTGLKGSEINERMKELMGIQPINEHKLTSSNIQLTKLGPDGKTYAIVREKHEYFIKSTDKKNNIVFEDFNYSGGLQNKKSEAYSTYSKAIKHLNLKFNSIAESMGIQTTINVFETDNILGESGVAGFSSMGGNGFSNIGNFEGSDDMEIADKHEYASGTLSTPKGNGFTNTGNLDGHTAINEYDSYNDEPYYDDLRDADEDEADADDEADYKIKRKKEDLDESLTEEEQAVQDMIDEELTDDDKEEILKKGNPEKPEPIVEYKLSIARTLNVLDDVIDSLNESSKKKVYTLK